MRTDLTEAVKQYHQYKMDLKTVVDLVAIAVYTYPPMRNQWDEDQCSDFLCYFYSRIPPMIKRFRDKGSPFEALLKVAVHFQMKTFAMKMKKRKLEEHVFSNGGFWEKTLMENISVNEHPAGDFMADEYKTTSTHIDEIKNNEGFRKRLLMLLMKESARISESLLVHFVTITGYDREWIEEKLTEIRRLTSSMEERRKLCRERKNQALFDIYCIHIKLKYYNSREEREELLEKLENRTQVLRKVETLINKIPAGPTHKQISKVLEIPKGTVDSGLHYMAQKYDLRKKQNGKSGTP